MFSAAFAGVPPHNSLGTAIKNFKWQDLQSSWISSNRELLSHDFPRNFSVLGSQDTYSTSMDFNEGSYRTEFNYPSSSDSHFLEGLMPKKGIEAIQFLEEHPEYDGRGITVAIFDSGVDPAAAGLQVTTDGKPKVIDVLDCTGSGDVDTSTIVTADEDGFITGASGARLQINKEWINPTGEWRVGSKLAFSLFTGTLINRLKGERKKKWDEKQREALTEALRQLTEFDKKHLKPTEPALKKAREDLQNRVDFIQKQSDVTIFYLSYEDNGPVIDAVVWHDGNLWRAALDTQDMEEESGLGKLADCTPLTNYRMERKYGVFTRMDACTYVLNIFDDGNVLSIVTDCSPHGTHVAGITAAHHPEEPLLNGVAPGAQIVSCKIGDTRLGSMEMGTGLVRALIAVVETKCDLINMSYGEPTSMPNYGRFIQLAEEVVNKHGVIFVSSAGNNGPSLTTVGAPGGTSSSILSVGAYVTPSMAASAHSLVETPTEGVQYTWSSRGPTADGDIGVTLSALGGAVAPVPKWTLQPRMLMNGTSMSSPCACGGIALVLSALKAEGRKISPHVVRKALENTAAPVHDVPEETLTIGRGLLQVDRAYKYLQTCEELPPVHYTVEVGRGPNTGVTFRGVYLREAYDCRQASEWNITVKPQFPEDADNLNQVVPFEERVKLESGNLSWLKCPEYLLLTNNGRSFNIVVDPTGLKDGLHYAEVVGVDSEAPWRGPLFRIPVTICKPLELKTSPPVASFSNLSFVPGAIERRFISVPEGTTWAEATLKMAGFDTPRRFYVNAVQLVPKQRPFVWSSFVNFQSPSSKSFAFPLIGGVTMELTIAQFWSSGNGSHIPATADVEIEYHSLLGVNNEVLIKGSEGTARVDVKAALGSETLAPSATLKKVRVAYRPVEAKVAPLSALRDKLTDGRQINALTLTYKFSLAEGGNVTPRIPILNGRMYDNEFESQFYMLCDSNKRVLSMGDVYPVGVKLSKGDYTLLLHIRHDNMNHLEKLKKAVLLLDRDLEDKNSIKLGFSSHIDGVITGGGPFKSALLAAGETRPFYIVAPTDDRIPKDATPGSLLLGEISYGEVSVGNRGGNGGAACPSKARITFVVPPPPKSEDKAKEKEDGVKKNVSDTLEEEVRDAKIKVLSSFLLSTKEEREEWEKLAESFKADYPKHLQLMIEILNKVSGLQGKEEEKFSVVKIIEAADDVIRLVNTDSLARHFAMKCEAEDADAAKVKKEMEKQRDALADALYKKGLALIQLEEDRTTQQNEKSLEVSSTSSTESDTPDAGFDKEKAAEQSEKVEPPSNVSSPSKPESSSEMSTSTTDELEQTFAELRKWADTSSSKYLLLTVKREKRVGRLGSALKFLGDLIQDESMPPQKNLYEIRIQLLEEIGWSHLAAYERKWLSVRFPTSCPLF
ncbi:tripeptidyl-peptidase 2 isoform X4 [Physcomitrium patens]|uniref:tripeptidyl-peptidase 2 isoform X4 n=1 Tax=Physcomitrium patens TaxID=3218 RepID=UPI000D15746C|nr:tripeptidyl-peptidase 2-like isoform X4 [Physcomitrium patens]|eukprot:XP_024379679.1 tripeptidyl-peptidase 2-like isoform X4 [Physcomitrella patens]